jgi:hypothetical protein
MILNFFCFGYNQCIYKKKTFNSTKNYVKLKALLIV